MKKIPPPYEYPPEEGRFIRGNDFSPVAVCVILSRPDDQIPQEIEALVRSGIESGAALSGTVQTENIGFEKIICNVIANPNIRYLVLTGPESEGHLTGEALIALFENGVDVNKRIIGTDSPHPLLYNIPIDYIERFREQVSLINLQFKGTPESISRVVRACYQETPTDFEGYTLYDIGAYSKPPLIGCITQRVMEAWKLPKDKNEEKAVSNMQELIRRIKKKQKEND
ncbi:MAG: tetrahydromethanopterin S-methyltransferase subunit A [Spirochaetales bacterium]|nr:tetrahydromethanopterin S-methyltransferase subunit A [Spirochaetales bacterium]